MTDMAAVVRVAEIRAREKAATEGPWTWDDETLRGKDRNAVFYPHSTKHMKVVRDLVNHEPDAEFIAAARSDIPFLLARLDEANETLREIKTRADEIVAGEPPSVAAALDIANWARAFLSGGDTTTKETT